MKAWKSRSVCVVVAAIAASGFGVAHAQVPVADSGRESQERSIAKCMTAANGFNKATVPADTGTKGSVAAPAAANATQTASVGSSNVTGWAGAGSGGASSVGTTTTPVGTGDVTGGANVSSGAIGSMDFSFLLGGAGGVVGAAQGAAFNIGTGAQVLNALSSVSGALTSNSGALTAAAVIVGTINPSQGAWDQNTAARLAAIATWNQAIQAATTTAQLRNQLLLSRLSAAAAAAAVMRAQ